MKRNKEKYLYVIGPKNEAEGLLRSITRNCQTLIEQTRRKAEETLEFEMIRPGKFFRFDPHIQVEGSWMTGLIKFEVYHSVLNKNTTNKNF